MLKAVFFDLDGTLLPFDEQHFIEVYFKLLCKKIIPLGYEQQAFVNNIWKGTKLMYLNDGSKTNEEVFWDFFKTVYGDKVIKDKPYFDEFYTNEFKEIHEIINPNPKAKEIVQTIKNELNLPIILATNPIFPLDGTLTRMAAVNLYQDDFAYITSYENSSYSKPNPNYFQALLDKFNLKSDEVILFGNSEEEDYLCTKQIGIETYLVGDYIIKAKQEVNAPHLCFDEIIPTIKKHMA